MTDRYVRIDIMSKGADQVKKDFDDLKKDADELKGLHEVDISANDDKALERMDALKLKLDLLKKEGADIPLTVGNDEFNIKILEARAKLEDLDKKASDTNLNLNTDRFHAEIIKSDLELDKLKRKADELKLGEEKSAFSELLGKTIGSESLLGRLFGGGGSGGEVAGGALGGGEAGGGDTGAGLLSALGGANNEYFGGAIAGLIGLAGSLAPSLGPFALGGGVGIGGILASYLLGHNKNAFGNLENTGKSTLNWSLLANANKPHGGTAAGTNFVSELSPILAQVSGFIKTIGPGLADIFRASIPFISTFTKILEQMTKLLLPSFTESMKELTPYLPQITQGFALLSEGVADFIKDLGPGMKNSATVFKAVMDAVKGILIALAFTADGLADAFANIGHTARVSVSDLHNAWDLMRHDTDTAFDDVRHDVASVWDTMWQDTIGRAVSAEHSILTDEMNWRHDISNSFDMLRHDVASTWDGLWSDIMSREKSNADDVTSDLRNWWRDTEGGFDTLRHTVASSWDSMWNDVKTMTTGAVRGVSVAIHGIEGAFRTPVAWVVDNVWDRLAGIWNKITGIVHLSSLKLPTVHMASGGVVPGSGRGDHVPAMLEPGERILSNEQVSKAGGHGVLDALFGRGSGGPIGFSGGGIIGSIGGVLSGIGKDLLGWVAKPLSFITSHLFGSVTSMLGHIPGSAVGMDDILKTMTTDLIANLGKQAKSGISATYAGRYTGKYGSGVAQWRPDVLRALKMEGLPLSLAAQVLYQMQTESGGNPNAINLTDSNAAAGDPSRGLLQTIMTTFRAYHWPGTSFDIYNPLANIAAAINYARHVYGPDLMRGGMGLGSGHGYATGGWITEPIVGTGLRSGQNYSFGEMGPEFVSPAGRYGGGRGDVYQIMVAGDTDPDAAALRIWQELRRYKKKHGNQPLGFE